MTRPQAAGWTKGRRLMVTGKFHSFLIIIQACFFFVMVRHLKSVGYSIISSFFLLAIMNVWCRVIIFIFFIVLIVVIVVVIFAAV